MENLLENDGGFVDVHVFLDNHYYLTIYSVARDVAESLLTALAQPNGPPIRVGRHLLHPNRVIYATIKPLRQTPVEAYSIIPTKGRLAHGRVSSPERRQGSAQRRLPRKVRPSGQET